jgi:hypothetical protein
MVPVGGESGQYTPRNIGTMSLREDGHKRRLRVYEFGSICLYSSALIRG